ncbi:Inner membrane protein YgaP [Rosistilla oblonga]|uniref:Inner membrane protein YgaP n=1 Tax=Rosistilla oblonga TaxID=2527990 RepID=A0A518IX41_9BACT|nr:rhodanese-like domain-containing protein [Rosistilla oblonga]QDV14170.1 Inner membrane protein YgaP [Rosistilla oblonga]QDV57645.1 Inner membrane protein YgaP [Rosistilla oblonga]
MKSIEVTQLSELQKNGDVELIDVRMPSEFRSVHAAGARNVPLDSLDPSSVFADRNGSKDQPLYVICQGGNRSTKACQKFVDAGFENIVNVEGGTTAWDKAGLPVVRGKQTMPLMQQVQLTAGSLVLLGAVLGYFVHPYFIGLSAFVGAGLMFAGATGTCGMASMLGKMPWNQCAGGGGSCSV